MFKNRNEIYTAVSATTMVTQVTEKMVTTQWCSYVYKLIVAAQTETLHGEMVCTSNQGLLHEYVTTTNTIIPSSFEHQDPKMLNFSEDKRTKRKFSLRPLNDHRQWPLNTKLETHLKTPGHYCTRIPTKIFSDHTISFGTVTK